MLAAASERFSAMLLGDFAERSQDEIVISEVRVCMQLYLTILITYCNGAVRPETQSVSGSVTGVLLSS